MQGWDFRFLYVLTIFAATILAAMFGNLMQQMQERQQQMRQALAQIEVEAEAGNGAVKVRANANRQILNIHIEPDLLQDADREQLEDLLLVAVNRALEAAGQKEAEAAQDMVQSMLPPGLGKLFG